MAQKLSHKIIRFPNNASGLEPISLRAGVYARYSCIGNTPYSADDQVGRIRYRLKIGQIRSEQFPNTPIIILENWVIKDEAKTGRVSREGYELIKSGIVSGEFDILLIDDISRITRDMGEIIDLYDLLRFHDVEGYSVADQISTLAPNARELFVFRGYANERQSKATSALTMRGLELRAINDLSTGQKPYGYRSEPTKHTMIGNVERPSHFKITIDHEQACVIRRIYSLYADGQGCRAIASTLNAEGIPSRHFSRKLGKANPAGWSEKTIWNILNQNKYVGIWKYRQTEIVRNPTLDKMVQKPRPQHEWLVRQREDLRIIPKELEEKVRARQAQIEKERLAAKTTEQKVFSNQGGSPKHLFVGTMKCGVCGGNFMTESGKGGGYIGCMNAHRLTTTVKCTNKRLVRMSSVEWHLIEELRRHLDNSETYHYLAKRYNELMAKKHGTIPQRLNQVESEAFEKKKAIANYDKFIRSGHASETIAASLATAEAKLKQLKAEAVYLRKQIDDRVYVTPALIQAKITRLAEILGKKMADANGIIRRLFPEKITMELVKAGKKELYQASGVINLHSLVKFSLVENGVPNGIRTRVTTLKG